MANVKISGLPAASAVADANEFEINEAGTSKKVTGSQIASYVDAELAPLKSADIGSTVQAYDADTTKNDVANTFTANQVISVTDNSNAALRVTQLGTGNAIVVEDSTNPDGSPFVVSSSGSVGIGASSPSKKLQIADTSGSLQLSLTNGTNELLIGANATEGRIYTFQNIPIQLYTNNTERMRITGSGGVSFGSSGTAYGTSGQVLTSNGNAAPTWADASGGGFTLVSSVASTSGSSIDFTGIPATAKTIILMLSGVSTNGTGKPLVRIGDSGGLETTGYASYSCRWAGSTLSAGGNDTTGFIVGGAYAASYIINGHIIISLLDSSTNTWTVQGMLAESADDNAYPVMGSKSLSGTLDRVSFVTPNTFDAGVISIMYQ